MRFWVATLGFQYLQCFLVTVKFFIKLLWTCNYLILSHFPGGNTWFCSCESLVILLSTDQYITSFYVCFCSRTPYLIHIGNSLPLNSCLKKALLTHVFSVLLLQTLDSTSTLHLGAVWNSEITNKTHKNAKNMALNRQKKDTCLQYESWTVKADVASFNLRWKHVHVGRFKNFPALCISLNNHKMPWVLIWRVRNKFLSSKICKYRVCEW